MSARELYEGVLIEINKEDSPNLLLEDFNYFANKAINNYINKRYNIYDINQQTTDDLRVLKSTAILKPTKITNYSGLSLANGANYEIIMPSDYLHLLNCICIYSVKKTYKCYNAGDTWRAPAKRLTADMYSLVLDNFWNKPTYKKPYYYIHNVNTSIDTWINSDDENNGLSRSKINYATVPTNPYDNTTGKGTDISLLNTVINLEQTETPIESGNSSGNSSENEHGGGLSSQNSYPTNNGENNISPGESQTSVGIDLEYPGSETFTLSGTSSSSTNNLNLYKDALGKDIVLGYGGPESLSLKVGNNEYNASLREKGSEIRYGNRSKVRVEIRYGTDDSIFQLTLVYIDYIKAPQHIRLTQEQLDYTEDKSQLLEYPDYVCQEIINELVHLIMEKDSNSRLQTHPVVSLSIANPTQALTPEAAGQTA